MVLHITGYLQGLRKHSWEHDYVTGSTLQEATAKFTADVEKLIGWRYDKIVGDIKDKSGARIHQFTVTQEQLNQRQLNFKPK